MSEPTDSEVLAALHAGGVDNWDWYGESLAGLTDAQMKDDSLVLDALRAGGVDNWEWYGESLRDLYQDEEEDEVEPASTVEPVVVEEQAVPLSEERLRAHLGDEYEAKKDEFWKRSYRPKAYDKAMKVVAARGTMEEARLAYLDLVIGKDH